MRPTKQFLAQRHKHVLDKECKEQLVIESKKGKKSLSKCSKLEDDVDGTRPAVEIITPYQKGAVAAKILLTDPSEKKTRFKLLVYRNQKTYKFTKTKIEISKIKL